MSTLDAHRAAQLPPSPPAESVRASEGRTASPGAAPGVAAATGKAWRRHRWAPVGSVSRSAVLAASAGVGVHMAFQPVVSLAGLEVVGVEALARFTGAVTATPQDWFARAETVGCARRLELGTVQLALDVWQAQPIGAQLAVNVSARTLVDPALLTAVLEAEVPYGRLVVEITEHASVDDDDEALAAIERLRAAGARVALDDVGAGFSSLELVNRLRPDIVKLDRALVARLRQPGDLTATRATAVAREIGAAVWVEGVESAEDLIRVRRLGADAAQGDLFGCPSTDAGMWAAWAGASTRSVAVPS